MPMTKHHAARSPRGVLTDKPVYVRLMPSEQAVLEASALEDGRSLSNMARVFILAGMRAVGRRKPKQAPTHQQSTSIVGD